MCEFLCYLVSSAPNSSTTTAPQYCTCYSLMTKKRPQEFSTSPKAHCAVWRAKQTRWGTVHSAEIITQAGSTQTPKRPKKHIPSRKAKFTKDQTPIFGEAIEDAVFPPPIPMPDLTGLKKRGHRGKVRDPYIISDLRLKTTCIVSE